MNLKLKRKIGVLIVEDSLVVQELLRNIIDSDPDLEVVGIATTAEEGLELVPKLKPDVISLDIRLPKMNGFEFTTRIMRENPTPIVVISASLESDDLNISMNALKAGALTVLEKPVGITHKDYEKEANNICTQLKIMSEIKVIRQRSYLHSKAEEKAVNTIPLSSNYKAIGIAASTGGPCALVTMLNDLPRNIAVPIFLVQHMQDSFLAGFAQWLSSITGFKVCLVDSPQVPVAGTIYMSKPDKHLGVNNGLVESVNGPLLCGLRPSGTYLFQTMAKYYGKDAIGIILTGMGEDGALGLKAMKDAGACTIAEHESTAVVYGMPKAAVNLGAAYYVLPVYQIPSKIKEIIH